VSTRVVKKLLDSKYSTQSSTRGTRVTWHSPKVCLILKVKQCSFPEQVGSAARTWTFHVWFYTVSQKTVPTYKLMLNM